MNSMKHNVMFDSALLCENIIHKSGSALHIALSSDEDRDVITCNLYEKFGHVVFRDV